ncbi:PAS domain-containing protein [Rhodopirellula sallentina]|uniref:histidine kinase n=1 Tax=Rhodopirellula sallentina SM41 TaxID=1263870 RepID=M5U854_9BACT|nr:PAS domain S-box protein [Rhodopirellula sallentina]EMI52133.1 PAS/PAC sensor signal transduction histidine kinase [Rhodopirellula sallentina SM41]
MNDSKNVRSFSLSRNRIGLVWGLTAVGLSTVLLLLIASCWSLVSIRQDRVASDALRTTVSKIASEADQLVEEFVRQSAAVLRGQRLPTDATSRPIRENEMAHLLHKSNQTDPRIANIVEQVDVSINQLRTLNVRCAELALERSAIHQYRESCIAETNAALDELQIALVASEQTRMLEVAAQVHRFRQLSGEPAKVLANDILRSWTPLTIRSEEAQEIDELRLLRHQLISAVNPDTLIDIRDNQIRPRFARLRRILDRSYSNDGNDADLRVSLTRLETAFFGEGFEDSDDGRWFECGEGGLYRRCCEWLQCDSEREGLRDEHANALHQYATTKTKLLDRLSALTSQSAINATGLVALGFKSIFAVGLISITVFLVLAKKVDRTLASQFSALSEQSIELAKAKAKAEKLSLIAKYTDDAVVITGPDTRIEWVNEGFTRLTGYTLAEVAGLIPGHFLQGPDTDRETVEKMRYAVRDERGFDVEILNYRKDGVGIWLDLQVRPIYGRDGELTNFIAIQSDITERKNADAKLTAANRDLVAQKQTLDTVIESVSSGIVSIDANGKLLSYNQAAEQILGVGCDSLKSDSGGASSLIFLDPITMHPVQRSGLPIARALKGEHVRNEEYRIRYCGQDTIVSITGTPFSIQGDAGAVLSFIDITERWERDLSLRRLRQGLDSGSDTMIIFDSFGTVIDLNRACCEALGYKRSELLGASIVDLDPLVSQKPWNEYWTELREAKSFTNESTMTRRDGTSFPIEASTNYGSFCGSEYACRIARDISDRKRAEREREVLASELQDAARQAGMAELAGDVLHNVGNALNSINVSTQAIRDRIESPTVLHLAKASAVIRENEHELGEYFTRDQRGKRFPAFLSELSASATRDREAQLDEIRELMNKVEHIKEIVASQKTFTQHRSPKEPVAPSALLDEAVKMNLPSLRRHGVQIEHDYDSMPDCLLEKHCVIQVLVNLIKNAKESVVIAEVPNPCIRLSIRRVSDHVVFSVEDNGIGIAEESLIEIFRHGFTTKATGHGFGLHSSANVAQELGGSLTAESRGPRHGATFALSVPALEIAPCMS